MRTRTRILVSSLAAMLIGIRVPVATSTGANRDAAAEKHVRARGDGFSVPIPTGFSVSKDERLIRSLPGGVLLVADKRATPGAFLGGIVVLRVDKGVDLDPTDSAFCRELARRFTAPAPVLLKAHHLVKTSVGNTCQWEVVDKSLSTRLGSGTIMCKTMDNCWSTLATRRRRPRAATS